MEIGWYLGTRGRESRDDRHTHADRVTTFHPGCIATDISANTAKTPLMTTVEKGVRSTVKATERESSKRTFPPGCGVPAGFLTHHLPLRLVAG
ncbi:hypothetical protein AB0L50_35200 [Streptomyces flaveolus]|uniref:hypothetical protein n=1 Tax=Streptomyces flaveolus TaxID=67297 RepID=UPI003430AD40